VIPSADERLLAAAARVGSPDNVLRHAARIRGAEDLERSLIDAAEGKLRSLGSPFPTLNALARPFVPGTVSMLISDPGAGKSLLLLQLLAFYVKAGVPASVFMLEDTHDYHMRRCLAQVAGNSNLADGDWIAQNGDKALDEFAAYEPFLAEVSRSLHCSDLENVSIDFLIEWVEGQLRTGSRLVCVDPISLAQTSERPWDDAVRLVRAVTLAASQTRGSVLLATHPKKGSGGKAGLDDIAGGSAYSRLVSTAIWLRRLDKPKRVTIQGPCGPFTSKITRSARIAKSRNGSGAGMEIGFDFDPRTLLMAELGVIHRELNTADDETQSTTEAFP
jgi:hypothetical protein